MVIRWRFMFLRLVLRIAFIVFHTHLVLLLISFHYDAIRYGKEKAFVCVFKVLVCFIVGLGKQ